MEETSHHQPEEFGKGEKETPVHMSYQPPRILLAGIHLCRVMHAPLGSTVSQNDWPETTQKLTHHRKTQDCEPRGRAVLLGSLTWLLSTRVPLPNKVSCFVTTCVSLGNSFPSVRQEPTLGLWKGDLFLQHF